MFTKSAFTIPKTDIAPLEVVGTEMPTPYEQPSALKLNKGDDVCGADLTEPLNDVTFKRFSADPASLQHMYSKHGSDFGFDNWNKEAANNFEDMLRTKVTETTPIHGTYRGQEVLHYYDANTGLNIMTKTNGSLMGGGS